LTEEVPKEMGQEHEKRPLLVRGLNNVENVVYYRASLKLSRFPTFWCFPLRLGC
jgi:hypothetical protein